MRITRRDLIKVGLATGTAFFDPVGLAGADGTNRRTDGTDGDGR